jgi:hypothetical protein
MGLTSHPHRSSRRFYHPLGILALLALLFTSLTPHASVPRVYASPPTGYRNVVDYPLITYNGSTPTYGGYAYNTDYYGPTIEDGIFPLDVSTMLNGEPSIKIATWWDWSGAVTLGGWNTYSIANYVENGYLSFSYKSNVANSPFRVRLVSQNKPAGSIATPFYDLTAATTWTTVNLRLTDLISGTANFRPDQMQQVVFSGGAPADPNNKPTFWINNLRYTTTDLEPSFPPIKVNQLGYGIAAEKYALVTGFPELLSCAGSSFQVRRVSDNSVAASGTLSLITDYEPNVSGERICRADFSSLTTIGDYYVTVSGLDDSPPFTISNAIYTDLLRDAARYFYYQRQGIAINAGNLSRPAGHVGNDDAVYFRSDCTWDDLASNDPLRNRYKNDPCGGGLVQSGAPTADMSGGWYDAGDYGKYVAYASFPVMDLLDAYDMSPYSFADGTLDIPESGNGKPDLLDEIKWELDWVLKMQHATSGGFYNSLYPNNCGQDSTGTYCLPHEITPSRQQRYVNDVDSNGNGGKQFTSSTAAAAAMLARASTAFQSVDATYAATLLAAAEDAWGFLEANPNNIIPKYGQANFNDGVERHWRLVAAAALFRATGGSVYNDYFLAHYNDSFVERPGQSPITYLQLWDSSRNNTLRPQYAHVIYFSSPNADATAKAAWTTAFNSWRNGWITHVNTEPWRNFLHDGSSGESSYYWGSTPINLEYARLILAGSRVLGSHNDPDLIKAVRAAFNYSLGINPLNKSFVTGYGTNTPTTLYSAIYSYDGKSELPPGYLVQGPNQYTGGLSYSRFFGKTYADNDTDWTTSEQAIYYNARLVYTVTWLKMLSEQPIYTDSLATGWNNWSWDTTVDFNHTNTVYSGTAAMAVTHNGPWAGLYLRAGSTMSTSGYSHLRFAIHGGSNGRSLRLYLYDGSNAMSPSHYFTAPPNSWTQVLVPLSSLGNPTAIHGLVLQDQSGASGVRPVIYLDAVGLVP